MMRLAKAPESLRPSMTPNASGEAFTRSYHASVVSVSKIGG